MIDYVLSKPLLATATQFASFSAWMLSIVHLVNPLVGFASGLVFLIIAIYKLKLIQLEWKRKNAEKKNSDGR